MISSLKFIKQIAICRRVTLTLCCCLLIVPNLPNVYNLQQKQHQHHQIEPKLEFANNRHHYNLIASDNFNQQYQGSGNLVDEQGDNSFVAELLNSFVGNQQSSELLLNQQQSQQQHQHGTPGHYEFEVVPKMEPPSAPRPPFKQANHACPGSGKFE